MDNDTWLEQMELLQKQVDEVSAIIIEAWKPVEAFLLQNRSTVMHIAKQLGLITTRGVKARSSIRKYYKRINDI